MGDLKAKNMMHTITEVDVKSGAIMARNAYNVSFRERVAFFDVDETVRTITCDRTEFIGRNGTMANPDAVSYTHLDVYKRQGDSNAKYGGARSTVIK